ncbi:Rieske 2Fe-2S domain-containing protein [Lentisalinibacter orientalis]|uniref:Rieske 2Fe-2S domain-containing protein n=1 Tax=Lentisalinibacter orientalis TaxID=2992241 RepID=UPI00386AABE8
MSQPVLDEEELYEHQVTGFKKGRTRFPRYDSAALGFREYWYPVMFGRSLKESKGQGITLLGRRIAFFRSEGKAYAIENRCAHRGVPLDGSFCDFAGTISCPYHGWVYELESGKVVAALTDGPDSRVAKADVSVRTYPVKELGGLIWVFLGDGDPHPLSEDIPEEFLAKDARIVGRVTERPGDWRHAAENGYDEGHVKYLHRRGVWTFWRRAPAWGYSEPVVDENSKWLTRTVKELGWEGEYPGLGRWPKRNFWRWRPGARGIRIRLPGTLRVQYANWAHYEWYVPTTEGNHRYLQFIVKRTGGVGALWLKMKYALYIKPFFHTQFNNQDAWMVEGMETPPEILYRPDQSIVSWRRFVEKNARLDPETEGQK